MSLKDLFGQEANIVMPFEAVEDNNDSEFRPGGVGGNFGSECKLPWNLFCYENVGRRFFRSPKTSKTFFCHNDIRIDLNWNEPKYSFGFLPKIECWIRCVVEPKIESNSKLFGSFFNNQLSTFCLFSFSTFYRLASALFSFISRSDEQNVNKTFSVFHNFLEKLEYLSLSESKIKKKVNLFFSIMCFQKVYLLQENSGEQFMF